MRGNIMTSPTREQSASVPREPADDLVQRLREVITRGCDYSTGVADHAAWCGRIHWCAEQAAARISADAEIIRGLREECANWRTWGTIEVAIRNPSVAESMRHWEGRAERAEAKLAQAMRVIEAAQVMRPYLPKGSFERTPEVCACDAFDAALAELEKQ
jgi:hypothetical protein